MADKLRTAAKSRGKSKAADKPNGEKKPRGKGVPFHAGYDERRNYKGRPNSHDELREMIRNIGAQMTKVETKDGKTFKAPLAYLMLHDMFLSRDARDHQNILEHGWGKVTQGVDVRTWRDNVIDLLRSGKATPEMVRESFEAKLADELIAAAGLAGGTSGES